LFISALCWTDVTYSCAVPALLHIVRHIQKIARIDH